MNFFVISKNATQDTHHLRGTNCIDFTHFTFGFFLSAINYIKWLTKQTIGKTSKNYGILFSLGLIKAIKRAKNPNKNKRLFKISFFQTIGKFVDTLIKIHPIIPKKSTRKGLLLSIIVLLRWIIMKLSNHW